MKTHHAVISFLTKEKYQFIDLTEQIREIVKESKVHNGIINIVSRHTTTAILLNENEPLLLSDFMKEIKRLFPHESQAGPYGSLGPSYYQHDNIEQRRIACPKLSCNECQNADAHCRSIFLTNFQTLNIINGELDLGPWQSILFLELDRAKSREISVMVMGEEKKNDSSPDDVVAYWPGPGC